MAELQEKSSRRDRDYVNQLQCSFFRVVQDHLFFDGVESFVFDDNAGSTDAEMKVKRMQKL